MGLGFLSSQASINLLFITVHAALYEDLIPYVHAAHDLESLVRSTKTTRIFGAKNRIRDHRIMPRFVTPAHF
jgi:hypothetical protein